MLLWYSYRSAQEAETPVKLLWENVGFQYGAHSLFNTVQDLGTYLAEPRLVLDGNTITRPTTMSISTNTFAAPISGGIRILTTTEVEGFDIVLSVPALYRVDPSAGYKETSVQLGIYYRLYDPADPPTDTDPWTIVYAGYQISGKQRAEILKTVPHYGSANPVKLPKAKYEILLVRLTEDHTGNMNYADDVYVKELTEITYAKIAYKHTALLGIKIRATDQLSGSVPTVTSLVKGVKVLVPSNLAAAYDNRYDANGSYNADATAAAYAAGWVDGEMVRAWTDNPVWCLYDLLTNKRYGLGDYYRISEDKKGLVLANFYLLAKYCDDSITYTDKNSAGTFTKKRPRFALNIVLDQSKNAATWVTQILSIMRGSFYYSEGVLWVDIDRPKPVSQIFTMSSIKEFSQSSTSFKSIPNCYEVQWINPLTNYEIDTFRVEADDLRQNPTLEEYKKSLQLIGVTNFDQAKCLTKYALLSGKERTKFVTFKTGTKGLYTTIGDIIGLQHDVPQWGFGGKVVSYNTTTKTLELSSSYTCREGETYYIKIGTGAEAVVGYTIQTPASPGDYTSVVLVDGPSDDSITSAHEYIIGAVDSQLATFKVMSVKRDTDETCEVSCVQYTSELFDYCDSAEDIGVMEKADYSLLVAPVRASVQGVQASLTHYQDSLGVWKTGVEVFYTAPASSFWQSAQLHYAPVGVANFTSLESNNTGYFFIPQMPDGEYRLVITSNFIKGKQTLSDALADMDQRPWTFITVDNYAPADSFMLGVTGLCIVNKQNSNEFVGRDCKVTWKRPSMIDATSTAAGEEVAGAASSSADNWFSHYKLVVQSPTGAIRRVEKLYSEEYTYTHEFNINDGVTRSFVIVVSAVDKLGRESAAKSIYCTNPAPVALS